MQVKERLVGVVENGMPRYSSRRQSSMSWASTIGGGVHRNYVMVPNFRVDNLCIQQLDLDALSRHGRDASCRLVNKLFLTHNDEVSANL